GRSWVSLPSAVDMSVAVASFLFHQVMSSKSLLIFSTLILDGLAGLSGGLLSERWLIRHQAALTAFAAGAILGAVFLDFLPESVEALGASAVKLAFSGFVALAIIEWLIGHRQHHNHHRKTSLSPPY